MQAPLGWLLSKAARDDLAGERARLARLGEARSVFQGGLTCDAGR